ncbi:MAG TPA: EAL domain-containing protein [Vicinamibacterales bacterium]|nr:EAL domain-containing protein [Vicinamibacterales bacterium]
MSTTPGTLLVVDDNEVNRDILSRRLRRQGYQVETAVDGRHALELVEAQTFALVLLDIEMPGLSGLEVLEILRRRWSASQLPVIIVTARQESRDVVAALNRGANDYLTKPIDLPIAVARIQTQLARKQAEAALQESEERYALAMRGANDGLWDWNLRTDAIYFSPRWRQMIGLPDETDGDTPETWFGRVHPDDREPLMADIAAHLDELTPQLENQHRVLHADGAYRWMLTRGVAVRGSDRKPYRMAGSQTDITEGKVSDPLTGLPNRVLFLDRLGRCIERAKRHNEAFAVLFLDLDRFKLINDSLGHQTGDRLLVAIAHRLEGSVRAADTVARVAEEAPPPAICGEHTIARLGGDEFTILLEGIRHVSDAVRVAERILENLRQPFEVGGHELFTSASIGIATSETGYEEPEDLLRDADTALYQAKALGKARCEVFDAEMRDKAVARLALETDLRKAVERQEFELRYQPIVSFQTGLLAGFEALIRWRHPARGLVEPAEFIHVAEETGLIVPIGAWVTREACRQMRAWQAELPWTAALTVHVNLSGKQFRQTDLANQIEAVLRETGLPASNLSLEITESAIIDNLDSVVTILSQLEALGVRIAIDDFGTGHSSLSYLHRFPIHSLKIDRSFVKSMSSEQSGIVRAIVGLAHALELQVIAEGVETAPHLTQLTQLGCEFGQGYLFAAPLEVAHVRTVLASSMDSLLNLGTAPPASAAAVNG